MALRVVLYFGLLALGWVLSSKGLIHSGLMKKISHVQTVILFGLIFVMGIRVGMDEQVVSSIGQIGVKAAVFAAVTAGLSILLVYAARKKLFNEGRITGAEND